MAYRISTTITKLLGITHPVIMGGMTGVGTPELAAAVSKAGGLGIFAIHNAGSPENAREWIRQMKVLCPDQPFGCNLTILPTIGPPPPYEEYARVIIEEGVKVVETAGSNPKKWISLFKNAGLITIHKCVTIRHALSAERLGVDIISLDGFECAGLWYIFALRSLNPCRTSGRGRCGKLRITSQRSQGLESSLHL
eukprot:TRINITY_DN2750_c0_g2_i5.p1 TRINITY_DN2750_c0_g2~~TRINITY_DN2750_c0_g2_i5.p1  ORF type:complete len:195 (-),score=10.55 TRINITY_DN2750_c0_g2_i5:619-1203(-)